MWDPASEAKLFTDGIRLWIGLMTAVWLKRIACFYKLKYILLCVPSSSVGIATGYRLDGPGIESRWG
jgi:hypothetical protein